MISLAFLLLNVLLLRLNIEELDTFLQDQSLLLLHLLILLLFLILISFVTSSLDKLKRSYSLLFLGLLWIDRGYQHCLLLQTVSEDLGQL